jgi:GTPase SAR1 family protein
MVSYLLIAVTKRQSFENIEKWVESNDKADIPVRVLVGNKVDLYSTSKDAVQKTEAVSLAKKLNMEYF